MRAQAAAIDADADYPYNTHPSCTDIIPPGCKRRPEQLHYGYKRGALKFFPPFGAMQPEIMSYQALAHQAKPTGGDRASAW